MPKSLAAPLLNSAQVRSTDTRLTVRLLVEATVEIQATQADIRARFQRIVAMIWQRA
jgi:hypothetical protein